MSGGGGIRISKGRFEAFIDGVFAIAITLLVLGFQAPKVTVVNEATMTAALLAFWPQYLVYVASFVTVGIMWFNHYALFHHARYVSYGALIANLALLLFVAFLPFPTLLLGQDGLLTPLVFFYSLIMFMISLCFGVLWYVAKVRPDERGSFIGFLRSRSAWNTLGPAVYAVAMILAFASPLASLILIAAIAVFYVMPWTVSSALAAGAAGSPDEAPH
jgi:uncharacterized membrane protein